MPLSSDVDPHWLQLVTMRIRIHLFISMRIRIRIKGNKPIRIYADLDPDPSQTV